MRIAYGSDVGRKRAKNVDSVGNFKNRSNVVFVILADGLGGYQGGEVASEMAVSHLGYLFEQTELNNSNDAKVWLEEKLSCENQMIIERSKQYQDLEGMGTTVVCAMFFENKCLIAHLGDSRAYILHDQKLVQLTEDHSLVNELVKRGEISADEAKHHPQKNIVDRKSVV